MKKPDINEMVWQVVASIPKGKVATYGQIAKICAYPDHARYVGTVLKNLPDNTTLPWYRVVNAQGKISFNEGTEAYKKQRTLLETEGVLFKSGKISLAHYRW